MNGAGSLNYLDKPIDHWIGRLQDSDPLIRRLAVYALGMIGPPGGANSIPKLTAALEDPESFVRVWAAAALARMDPCSATALQILIAALRDERSFVRSLAAWHLGRQGPKMSDATDALAVLHEILEDPDPSVRAEAELALKALQAKGVRVRG